MKHLFEELLRGTADPPGATRASFGEKKAVAPALSQREAVRIGLEVLTDAIGNLCVTLPGRGGDLVCRALSRLPRCVWASTPRHAKVGTSRTLVDHMIAAGYNPQPFRKGRALLGPTRITAIVELHIEQGPILVEHNTPVGIVTAIQGNMRHRHAKIFGQTTHVGGVARHSRQNAVLAGVELVAALEVKWLSLEGAGHDFVRTVGKFGIKPGQHGINKVPGALHFTLDFRSSDPRILDRFDGHLHAMAMKILPAEVSRSTPALPSARLRRSWTPVCAKRPTPWRRGLASRCFLLPRVWA